jgi:putative phosphoribosyl transferase
MLMFRDRKEAGRALADALAGVALKDPVIFGIPRGGVIVAAEVARKLDAPLDVIVPAKIRAPYQPELGVGAVAPDGSTYLDEETVQTLRISDDYLKREIEERKAEIRRREALYRGDREPMPVEDRSAVIVDDGIATGGTAIAAARSLRRGNAAEVVLAVPVAPAGTIPRLEPEVDRLICLATPEPFLAVGRWYEEFDQVSDEQVGAALAEGPR